MRPHVAPSRHLKIAGGLTVLLGLLLLNELAPLSAEAGYLGLLAGIGAGVALLSGIRLWFDRCCLGRTLAATVSLASLGAQLLDRYVGLPGRTDPGGSSDAMLVVVLLLTFTVVALLLLDTRHRADGPSQTPPYALVP